ncbi:MAG: helix-turn-helix domain-containing protein [Propionibacteriaceae bacterium]|jgi:excisionase family DNA binding protein|nr:helix-turn-helix domain-containing protein [Propionibacteriaceae bacterium]
MSRTLVRDAEALHHALETEGDEVSVSLSRGTAEMLARLIEAQSNGQEIVITHGLQEVSPAEAALMLGMSRPQVRKLMDRGALPYRMVGSHYRIAIEDVRAFLDAERRRRKEALAQFSALENNLGLTE